MLLSEQEWLPFSEQLLLAWKDLENQGHEAIRELIKTDRYYLLVKVLRRKDALHPWVYARCREVEAAPDGYIDIWAREHFKSSIITVAGSIQEVLRDPDITIGIFSHTKPIAKAFLAAIKREFEANTVLKTLFPDILYEDPERQSPSWSLDNGIIVKRQSNPNVGTVEAHGLVDGQPTSKHFKLLLYDDVVTDTSVYTPEQIQKTNEAWSLSDNLGSIGGRKWYVGTRYCSAGNMRVLMGDWSHRAIQDVKVGDVVVGWELRDGRRWLRRSRVINRGMHAGEPVNRYTLDSGGSVVCTADHRWWRGPHGGGPEYAPLALPEGKRKDRPPKGKKVDGALVALRQLLIPAEPAVSRAAAWLAGFFDGEGCIKKNPHHPSGSIQITQTMHNPELIDETRKVLSTLRFKWSENWVTPKSEKWNKRCAFMINGGWSERYRFLAEVSPVRRERLAKTLFGQLMTTRQKLTSVEPAGVRDVHWLETETGNYVIEGFCSSNSFADTYAEIIKRGAAQPRVYPATDDGTADGNPVLFTQKDWDAKKKNQLESTLACQMLCNPMAGHQRMFNVEDLQTYEVRPLTLMVYLLIDPARSVKRDSANTAMVVLGVDSAANKYLLDGVDHKMDLMDRWKWMRDLWAKWSDAAGVMGIRVGYERFGAIADLDYFKERQRVEGARFEITELEWPREGEGSKKDRVQRLVPDIKGHRFYVPHPTDERRLTSVQQRMVAQGYEYRLSHQIRRMDENSNAYDVTERFRLQVAYFPFGGLKDLVDAASRIYDIEPVTPSYVDQSSLEPEWT